MNLPIFPTPIKLSPGGAREAPPRGAALLRLGFRPFYLGAAGYAAIAVPLWVATVMGWIALPLHVAPLLWHAHEMLFGFACAVIVGFLLTAGQAWTGQSTPRGPFLGVLALWWLAARLSAVAAPYAVYAGLDLSLLPVVALILGRVLLRAGNRRNWPLVGLLLLLTVINGLFHAAVMGALDLAPMRALHAGLAVVIAIVCVMAGRVIPGFTMSATAGLVLTVPRGLTRAVWLFTATGLAAWVVLHGPGAAWPTALLLGAAGALQAALLWHWRPLVTLGRPILWILHAAYAWIPVGLGLLALGSLGVVPVSAGIHALAVGAIGGLVIGMITRTARGHTGRALTVSRAEITAYALVMLAAVLRVTLPLLGSPVAAWTGAALAWSAAFVIYLGVFGPWLMRPRIDGRDG